MNMKKTLLTLLTLFALCATTTAARNTDNEGPRPAPHQLKWHEAELGVVFHYDLHVFDGLVYGQGNNRINPIEDYNISIPTSSTPTSGFSRPRLPEPSLPSSLPPMKPVSDCGRAT